MSDVSERVYHEAMPNYGRMEVKIFGVLVGTASGWDGEDDYFTFTDFKPEVEFDPHVIACDSFYINMATGVMECWAINKNDAPLITVNTPMFLSLLSTASAGMAK